MAAEKGNQYALGNDGGRPLKFESVEELQKQIDAYFAECDPHWVEEGSWIQKRDSKRNLIYDEDGVPIQTWVVKKVLTKQIPYTITGLALALDTTRETLLDYEDREEYSDTIKRAKIKCQNYAEESLFGNNATGPIFNLKNNYKWKDKSENEITNPDGSLNPFNKLSVEELKKLAKDK